MPQKHHRYALKTKEAKQILTEATQKLKLNLENLYGPKTNVEVIQSETATLYLIQGKPALIKTENTILPTLTATEILQQLPKAIVDMGAVRFVCNGADIMAPGIVRYEGEFNKGDLILITDIKHGKPLALGETLLSSAEARNTKQGPTIKSKHYVSDKLWDLTKTATD